MGVLLKHGKVLGWVSALCCDPVSGGPKMGSRLALQTQLCNLASTLQNKSCMAPMFWWGGSCFGTHNPDLEEPGPHVLLESWSIVFWQHLENKVLMHFPNCALGQV
jgi:hypothetical protein